MVIQEVYEKFKHLDQLLSDKEWLWLANNLLYAILYDLWQAIKEAAENNSMEVLEKDASGGKK